MLGQLPPEPVAPVRRHGDEPAGVALAAPFDVDISSATKLWLLVQDTGSYSPREGRGRLGEAPSWSGPAGAVPLASLKPIDALGGSCVVSTAFAGEDAFARSSTTSREGVHAIPRHGRHREREVTVRAQPAHPLLCLRSGADHGPPGAAAPETPVPAGPA